MFLMIDNYDSFVYNLVRYLEELNEEVVVFRNDAITLSDIERLKPEGIILSPGPKRPEDGGICLDIIHRFQGLIPILGICLGHQIIGHVYGAKVIEGEAPVHGKVHEVHHKEEGLFHGLPSPFRATRYHSLVVSPKGLLSCLSVTCRTSDGTIMGIRHRTLPVEGVQFHPEAELTQYGHELLSNFIKGCRRHNGC